ncbi:hypothetical protein QQ73_15360, partial [Candidatus Endoriftia persephone str. Guaymas]|nr:hypothetical protein [Candidatus Endoriftia persephone str. Guaymas]
LRDANEKLFTSEFNDCTPPTLVSRSAAEIRSFLDQHQDIILKPLGGMGGASVFRVRRNDPNTSVIIETLTLHGTLVDLDISGVSQQAAEQATAAIQADFDYMHHAWHAWDPG